MVAEITPSVEPRITRLHCTADFRRQVIAFAKQLYYSPFENSPKTWGEAMAAAWRWCKKEAVKEAMKQGIVEFSFIKVDGKTVRKAIATTNPAYYQYEFKGNSTRNPTNIPFWDMEIGEWRSFSTSSKIIF
jgi:hypothetical protein